jgi:hypothetical protein
VVDGGFQEALASEMVSWCRVLGRAHAVPGPGLIGPQHPPQGSTRPVAHSQLVDAIGARAWVHSSYGLSCGFRSLAWEH